MLQGILEQSAVQNYPLGMRIAVDDRVFRYCRAIEAIGSCKGAYSDAQEYWEGNGDMPLADPLATEIKFDNKDAEPIVAHALKDGWVAGIALPADAASMYCMRIKDNEASLGAVPGAVETCTIQLYRPMPLGIVGAGHRSYVYPNVYANVKASGGVDYNHNYGTVVAVPLVKVLAATPYFWGLTWGIFYGQCGHWANLVGADPNRRIFSFDGVGGMIYRAGAPYTDLFFQKGGYLMNDGANNQWGAITGGDQLAMLQLSP